MPKKVKTLFIAILCAVLIACVICVAACDNNPPQGQPIDLVYQKAAELGYTGTLEEFLYAIKGKDGADGKDGLDGVNGVNGEDGHDGKNGKDGVGFKSVTLTDDGELIVYATDDTVLLKQKLPLCKHSYSNFEVEIEPTCISAGYGIKQCSKCGDRQYEVTPALGHAWGDGITVYEPNCAQKGLKVYTCVICEQSKSEVLSTNDAHKFENGTCAYCNITAAQATDNYYNGNYGYDYLSSMDNGDKLCAVYDVIHNSVLAFHDNANVDAQLLDGTYALTDIDCSEYGLTPNDVAMVWKTYMDDKPLYYWLSKSLLVCGTKITIQVVDDYVNGLVRTNCNEELYGKIAKYIQIADGESAYSAALAYHDAIISSINYAYKPNLFYVPEDAAWAHSIVGVFEEKGAVCEGYARAFQLLLNARGIQNLFVTGEGRTEKHAWNLVKLDDGNWYWYDLTWDDTPNSYWGVLHNYACVTDEEFLKNHTIDSPTDTSVDFLYELPVRATQRYACNGILLNEEFTYEGTTYVVIGYDILNVTQITAEGHYDIPETVEYKGREFSVVSVIGFKDGAPYEYNSVIPYQSQLTSVNIPSSVIFVGDSVFNLLNLQEITVDEQSTEFRAADGVLFTKNLFTLIQYPTANPRTEYTIPDETYYIAEHAFRTKYLEVLKVGKNVHVVGLANWGAGYPSERKGGNVIMGEWHRIVAKLTGEQRVIIDEENTVYKIKDSLLMNVGETTVYTGVQNIEVAIIPESTQRLDHCAFYYVTTLKKVVFCGDNLIDADGAFIGCSNLTEVTLCEGMRVLSESMFWGCNSLKTLTVPSSLEIIEEEALYYCNRLEEIVFSEGLTKIGKEAFAHCYNLKTLVIPTSVTNIGEKFVANSFNDNEDLANLELFYMGTAEMWNAIIKDDAFCNSRTELKKLYFYSEERPTGNGKYWHYVDGKITKW